MNDFGFFLTTGDKPVDKQTKGEKKMAGQSPKKNS